MKIIQRVPRALVDELLSKGRVFRSPLFSFRFTLGGESIRYTVVIGKKNAKMAVDRNYNRRVFREATRRSLRGKVASFTGAFFLNRNLREVPFDDLVSEISMALKRISIL